MIWTSIKAKLFLGIGLLVAALLGALKIQSARLERANDKNKVLTAQNDHTKEVAIKKKENATAFNSRRAAAKAEIKKTGTSKDLENPNEW